MKERIYKIVLLGEYAVGKTSLILRYVDDSFKNEYYPTLGFEISIKYIAHQDTTYVLAIWDLAGQKRFHILQQDFLKGTRGAILVYDVTRRLTFSRVKNYWFKILQENVGSVPCILAGNKIDLIEKAEVKTQDGKNLAKEIQAHGFFETSAKTGNKVDEIFRKIAKIIDKI